MIKKLKQLIGKRTMPDFVSKDELGDLWVSAFNPSTSHSYSYYVYEKIEQDWKGVWKRTGLRRMLFETMTYTRERYLFQKSMEVVK